MNENFWNKIDKEEKERIELSQKTFPLPHDAFTDDCSVSNFIKNFDSYSRNDVMKYIIDNFDYIMMYCYDNDYDFICNILKPTVNKFGNLFAKCADDVKNHCYPNANFNYMVLLMDILRKAYYNGTILKNEDIYDIVLAYNKSYTNSLRYQIKSVITDEFLAKIIMERYCNNETEGINKINKIIYEYRPMLTVDDIISIYHCLYDHMTDVLVGVMHSMEDVRGRDSEYQEMYGRCSLAILEYLEMQQYDVILKSLENYVQIHYMYYADLPIRFSILTVSQTDYPRIFQAFNQLYYNGIIVP